MNKTAARERILDFTETQWGLVTAQQALAAGLDRMTLTRLTSDGTLTQVARGVYRTAGAPEPAQLDLRAAWLQLQPTRGVDSPRGDDAVVSHETAAAVHQLGDYLPAGYDFTTRERRRIRRPDVRLHHRKGRHPEYTLVDGLPVATVRQTVLDLLAESGDTSHIGRVVVDASERDLLDPETLPSDIAPFAARYGHAPGDGLALAWELFAAGGSDIARALAERITAEAGAAIGRAAFGASGSLQLSGMIGRAIIQPPVELHFPDMTKALADFRALIAGIVEQNAAALEATAKGVAAMRAHAVSLPAFNTAGLEATVKGVAAMRAHAVSLPAFNTAGLEATATGMAAMRAHAVSVPAFTFPSLIGMPDVARLMKIVTDQNQGVQAAVAAAARASEQHDEWAKLLLALAAAPLAADGAPVAAEASE